MSVAVISANLGEIDAPVEHVPQEGVEVDYYTETSVTMPPRPHAMTTRLQARIPKCFGWQIHPGYDLYLWADSSLRLSRPDSVQWGIKQLGEKDILVFAHPHRKTVQEEIDFIRAKLKAGSRYVCSRYEGEDLDGLEADLARQGLLGLPLLASTAFLYVPCGRVQAAFKEWWGQIARYHTVDQIQLSAVLYLWAVRQAVVHEDIYHASHLTFVGHKR